MQGLEHQPQGVARAELATHGDKNRIIDIHGLRASDTQLI
jgi:hypothetical protein